MGSFLLKLASFDLGVARVAWDGFGQVKYWFI